MLRRILIGISIEFGPIFGFLIASEYMPFVRAATYFVAFTVIAISLALFEQKRVAIFPIIVASTVIIFGGATVIMNDPFYLIFKDTLYNGIFAIVILIGLSRGKSVMKPLFKNLFMINDDGWRIYSKRWAIFLIFLTISNEWARVQLTPYGWINFKIGITLLTVIFAFAQLPLTRRTRLAVANAWGFKMRN